MIRGEQLLLTLATGANKAVLPANPTRRYLRIGGVTAAAVYVTFGPEYATLDGGDRLAIAQPPLEYFHALMGDKMTQQVNIYNANGSTMTVWGWEGFD